MQNPLENFLLNLAEKIQTEKEYKDIVKDSQNVDVNKDVFAGFIEGISKTIRENVQTPSLSALEEKQDPLDNFLLSLGETLKNIPEKKKEDISEPVLENEPVANDLEQKIKKEKEEPDAFAGFVNNLANILKKEPDPQPVKQEQEQEQDLEPVKQEQKPVQDYVNILSSEKKKKEKPPIEKKQEENEETPDIKKFVTNFVSKELEAFKNDLTEKYLKKAAVLSEYAGGGGTNAVQYANGGVMNGDLNVSNVYPNDATGSIGSPSNRWDKIYANQVDSLSSNIVIELSGFYVDGDFTVNGTISAIGGNSNQWNSTYTTLNANSANYILDGGNTKGSDISIGTNDAYNLSFETNAIPRLLITSDTLSGNSSKTSFGAGSATGLYSFAEGLSTLASGNYSHAEGFSTIASGLMSHAEGNRTTATNNYSHAEGENSDATGYASHAEGDTVKALGGRSHAEGYHTVASGAVSHAAGRFIEAAHDHTWAWKGSTSNFTISTTRSQQFMVSASGGMFIPGNVGIGTDDNSNALTVVGTISTNAHGTSNQWNSTYTTLSANSGKYESAYTSLNANSGKYESTYTNLNTNSANYILSGGNITNSSLYIGSNTNYNLFLKTNNLPRVVITQAGNVGIGTGEVSNIVLDQSLIGYNFSVLKNSVSATASASLALTSDITANKMERSSGIGAFASALGWGSQAYTIGATAWQTAIANTEYFRIPIYSETNKTILINSLDSFWVDRSPNGPTNLALLYGTSIIPAVNNVSEITTGVTISASQFTDVSLQINQALATNPITILPGTSGFIFLVPYGAGTNTGNLRFQSNYPSGSANDLSFRGRISNEPFNKLTVNGTISAIGGNSNQWNSTYTTVSTFSAYWPITLGLGISSNINFGVCAGNGAVTANLQTIAGANIGDAVLVTCTSQRGSFASGEMSNITFDGIVTATNQISIRAHNPHNNTITLSALDFKILIFKSV